jgi:predicted nucleic acid-binding protein
LIAADTSSIRRYWSGAAGRDIELVEHALQKGELVVAPVVITELLSDPESRTIKRAIHALQTLDTKVGFWIRAGELRASLLASGKKAKLADCLIAQCCIDHNVPLITGDRDYRHFVKAGLELL